MEGGKNESRQPVGLDINNRFLVRATARMLQHAGLVMQHSLSRMDSLSVDLTRIGIQLSLKMGKLLADSSKS